MIILPGLPSVLSDALVVHQYVLSVTAPSGNGYTVPDTGDLNYIEGTVVILVASPAQDNQFNRWKGGPVEDSKNQFTQITMDDDKSIQAIFDEIVNLTIVATGGGITVPPANSNISCVKNTIATVKAIPNDGYEFKGWTGDIIDTNDTVQITMDADKLIGAQFNEKATVSTNNKKLYLATVKEKAYWNVDGKWTFFATPRHGNLKDLGDDNHPQYLNYARGDERYYSKEKIDDLIASGSPSSSKYYEPLTNSDPDNPELIFFNGDVVMTEVI
jgi:uncharacterized repeat protein (TIGR02543 family)